jgi:hypothetical protein
MIKNPAIWSYFKWGHSSLHFINYLSYNNFNIILISSPRSISVFLSMKRFNENIVDSTRNFLLPPRQLHRLCSIRETSMLPRTCICYIETRYFEISGITPAFVLIWNSSYERGNNTMPYRTGTLLHHVYMSLVYHGLSVYLANMHLRTCFCWSCFPRVLWHTGRLLVLVVYILLLEGDGLAVCFRYERGILLTCRQQMAFISGDHNEFRAKLKAFLSITHTFSPVNFVLLMLQCYNIFKCMIKIRRSGKNSSVCIPYNRTTHAHFLSYLEIILRYHQDG